MKERPILFSAPMVRAILDGRKTQTRRIVATRYGHASRVLRIGRRDLDTRYEMPAILAACPYGAPGDRLWVRESFCARYFDNGRPAYRADWTGESADTVPEPRWTPSIHMPRALSRIDLEMTAVRVERLHDITEEDIAAEGVTRNLALSLLPQRKPVAALRLDARWAWRTAWNTINGDKAPWSSDPFVWVVSFRRVRP